MGACYSCKSADSNTHSTAPMASENKSSRTAPYYRNSLTGTSTTHNHGSATSHGFGFKRKNPVLIKSTSSDRTTNLVQKYEKIKLKNEPKSKNNTIAVNNSNITAPSNANATRFGYRPANINKRILNETNKNIPTNPLYDATNQIERINNNAPSQQSTVNISKSTGELSSAHKSVDERAISHQKRTEILKRQFLGSDFSLKSQSSITSTKNQTSQKPAVAANKLSYRSGSHNSLSDKTSLNRNSYAGPTSVTKSSIGSQKPLYNSQQSLDESKPEIQAKVSSKIPMQSSGLPRPNSLKTDGFKKPGDNFITVSYKAPTRLNHLNFNIKPKLQRTNVTVKSQEPVPAEVAMQTSMDTLPDDSLENVDSKTSSTIGQLPDGDSGMGSSLKSSIDAELRNADNETLGEVDQIEPLSYRDSASAASFVTSPSESVASDSVDGLRSPHLLKRQVCVQESLPLTSFSTQSVEDSLKNLTVSETSITDIQKISPLSLDSAIKVSKSKDLFKECTLSRTISEDSTKDKSSFDSKVMKDSFNSSKSSVRTETFSPVSDLESRSDFLIDDEIADQPSLMVLNNDGNVDLMTQSTVEASKIVNRTPNSISKDDIYTNELPKPTLNVRRSLSLRSAEKRSPSHPMTLSVIAAHRQSMCSTLSSCSSINSDDLMMDFDGDRCNDFEEEDPFKSSRSKHTRQNSTSSTLDELNHLVDSQKETSMVRQKLASIRHRSRTISSPDMTQSLTEMPRQRSISTPLKPPRPIRILSDTDSPQGAIKLDSSSYRSLCQDVTNVKTMLFRLKRLLHDADTLNPFEANNWKNSMYQRVANFEAPHGLSTCQEEDTDQTNLNEKLTQENADLRRQLVFLEQQNADKDRTIKLLQQQMTKYTNGLQDTEKVESCNAATQTAKMRVTTSMDGISPTTVSNSEVLKSQASLPQPNGEVEVIDTLNKVADVKETTNCNQPSIQSYTNPPKRSISACNIPRTPSTSSVVNVSSTKSSFSSICSQPEVSASRSVSSNVVSQCSVDTVVPASSSSQSESAQARTRSGAFSNSKLTSYSNNVLNKDAPSAVVPIEDDGKGSLKSKTLDKQSKDASSTQNQSAGDGKLGLSRNSFSRSSGRFLSLFKIKKNQSSNA